MTTLREKIEKLTLKQRLIIHTIDIFLVSTLFFSLSYVFAEQSFEKSFEYTIYTFILLIILKLLVSLTKKIEKLSEKCCISNKDL